MHNNFLFIAVFTEKIKVRHVIATPAGAPKTFADKTIQTSLLAALKTIKILSM